MAFGNSPPPADTATPTVTGRPPTFTPTPTATATSTPIATATPTLQPTQSPTAEPTVSAAASGVKKYYYLGSVRVAMWVGDTVYYFHADHLGSTSVTTDSGGTIVSQQTYLPFGAVRTSEGAAVTDFSFTGQRADCWGAMGGGICFPRGSQ